MRKASCRICGGDIKVNRTDAIDLAIGAEVELASYLVALEALGDLRDEKRNLGIDIDESYLEEARRLAIHGAALIHDLHEAVHSRGSMPAPLIVDLLANGWYSLAHSTVMAVRTQAPNAFARAGMDLFLPPSTLPPGPDPPIRFLSEAHRLVTGATFRNGEAVSVDGD